MARLRGLLHDPSATRSRPLVNGRPARLDVGTYPRWSPGRWLARLRGRTWRSPEMRHFRVLFHLERHRVPAPRLLACGQRGSTLGRATAFTLVEWHPAAPVAPSSDNLRAAGVLLRQLHDAGCTVERPADVFVWSRGRVMVGDAAAVRLRHHVSERLKQRDLAALAAAYRKRLPRGAAAAFLAGYRGKPEPRRLRRCASNEPLPGLWTRLKRGFRRLRCAPDWPDFAGIDWADRIMTVEVRDRFHAKQGRSIGRWTLTAGDGRSLVVYLKRHFVLGRLGGLLACLWPRRAWSPGMQEWEHLQWAAAAGVPVPRAAAAGEIVGPGRRLQSFLAVEELTDMLPLHEAIPLARERLDPAAFRRWKRGLGAEMARLRESAARPRRVPQGLVLLPLLRRRSSIARTCRPSGRAACS